METRANYVLVGAIATAIFASLMLFAVWLTRASFNETFVQYEVVFQGAVRGIAKGGEVRFNGIKVGDVQTLKIDAKDPSRVLAEIRIDATTPVRTTTVARLEPVGLTGVALMQLTPGDPNDPLLKSRFGQPLPQIIAQPGPLDSILAASQTIAQRASDTLDRVQALLTQENIDKISRTLTNLEQASARLDGKEGLLAHSDRAVVALQKGGQDISAAALSVDGLSADARQSLDGGDLHQALAGAADASQVLANETLPDISRAAADLRRLSSSLADLAGQVQSSPLSPTPQRPKVKVAP
jgi:phospholipid/cholesterol/gamma-HCH transport system substrate-binding protein